MDQRILEHERRLLALNGNIAKGADAINALTLEVGRLGTKVAIYASVAGFFAAAASAVITSVIVYFMTS